MKKILVLFCFILAVYSVYFPFAYFNSNNDKKEVRVSHILVDTREKAEEIKKEINSGEKFENAAEKYSSCSSKNEKGDLGYMQRDRLPDNISKLVFKLPKNEISDPIQSENGWHLFKVSQIKYFSQNENFKYNPYRYVNQTDEEKK